VTHLRRGLSSTPTGVGFRGFLCPITYAPQSGRRYPEGLNGFRVRHFSTAVVNNPQQNTIDILCSCGVHLFAHESLLVAAGLSYRAERRTSRRKKRSQPSWSHRLIFSSVANKQQNQNHSEERDEPRGDQNRIERVGGRGGTCIGQPADQFEKPDLERDSRHPLYDERSLDEICGYRSPIHGAWFFNNASEPVCT